MAAGGPDEQYDYIWKGMLLLFINYLDSKDL